MTIDQSTIDKIMRTKVLEHIDQTFDKISESILENEEHSVYKYFTGENRFDHVKKHPTKQKALEQASRLNKNDPDDMHTYVVKKSPLKEDKTELARDGEHDGARGYQNLPKGPQDSNMYAVKIPDSLSHSKAIEYSAPAHIPTNVVEPDMKVEDIAPTWNGEDEVKADNRFLNLAKDKGEPTAIGRRDVKVADPMSDSEALNYPVVQRKEKGMFGESEQTRKLIVQDLEASLRDLATAKETGDEGSIFLLQSKIDNLRKKRDSQKVEESTNWRIQNTHVHTDRDAKDESPHQEMFDKKEPNSATETKVKKDVTQDLEKEGAKVTKLKVTQESTEARGSNFKTGDMVTVHDPENKLRTNLHGKSGKITNVTTGFGNTIHHVDVEGSGKHIFSKSWIKPHNIEQVNKVQGEKIKQADTEQLQKHISEGDEETSLGIEPTIIRAVGGTLTDPPPGEKTEQEKERESTPQGFGGEMSHPQVNIESVSLLAMQNRYRKGFATLADLNEAYSKCLDEEKKKKHMKWRNKNLKEEDIIAEALSKKNDTGFNKSKETGEISTVEYMHPETGHQTAMHTLVGKNELHRVFHDVNTNITHFTHNGKISKQLPQHIEILKSVGKKHLIKESMNDVADKHKTKIAKDTLKMTDAGALVMGGMSKDEARAHLKKVGHSDEAISKMEESIEELDEHITKEGDKWVLRSKKTGKNLGHFDSLEAAKKHESEIEFFKHQK
jgi:hypothetical protein